MLELKDPHFTKLFWQDITKLYGVSNIGKNLFFELIQLVEYNPHTLHNVITLTKKRKEKIFCVLEWDAVNLNPKSKYSMYAKYIKELQEKGIISKIEDDVYLINPDICGRTTWQNLRMIKSISLNITYDVASKTLITLVEHHKDFMETALEKQEQGYTLKRNDEVIKMLEETK